MIPWIIGGIVVVGLLFGGDSAVLADLLAAVAGRGVRVGRATSADALGVIRQDPDTMAAAAALDLDTYALARMLSSEEGNSPTLYKLAVGFAAVNYSHGRIAETLLRGKGSADGLFGAQAARYETGATGDDGAPVTAHAGKYASTALDPHEDDVTLARAILGGELADVTGGATNFFSPKGQDRNFAAGRSDKDADAVDAAWRSGGLVAVDVPGITPRDLTFYRPRGLA